MHLCVSVIQQAMIFKRWNGVTGRLCGATNIPHDNARISAYDITTDEVALYRIVRMMIFRHFPALEVRRHMLIAEGGIDCGLTVKEFLRCKTSNRSLARDSSIGRRSRGIG
jgi:hypothetical protein